MECEVLFLGFGPITLALAKNLIGKGYKVAAVTKRKTKEKANSEFSPDLFTLMDWQTAIAQHIISESTYIGWRKSPQSQPLGEDLINWVKSAKMETRKIHHLSSASVYSINKELFSESDYDFRIKEAAINSKQELENLVLEIGQEKLIRFVNYRISNVYGAGLNQGFINESINNFVSNNPIRIYKQVDLVRDYLSMDDLIKAFLELRLHKFTDEALNLSSGYGTAISEITSVFKVLNVVDLKFIEVEAPKRTLDRSVLSCKRLEEIIPWRPIGVKQSLLHLLQNLG